MSLLNKGLERKLKSLHQHIEISKTGVPLPARLGIKYSWEAHFIGERDNGS